jgi:hypothetical protein
MTDELIETRVSEIRPGDLWFLEGAWVTLVDVEVQHPDDRVGVTYIQDGDDESYTNPRGFEVAIVKRGAHDAT